MKCTISGGEKVKVLFDMCRVMKMESRNSLFYYSHNFGVLLTLLLAESNNDDTYDIRILGIIDETKIITHIKKTHVTLHFLIDLKP